jgi:hypothetical protein
VHHGDLYPSHLINPSQFSRRICYEDIRITHTYATKIVVIKGAYMNDGKKYGPRSNVNVPGGTKHASGGVAGSDSIFFIEQDGKFDLKPAEPSKGSQ